MILEFKSGGTPILFGVSKSDRSLSIAFPGNSYVFQKLEDLSKYKKFNPVENKALYDTVEIVKGFKTLEEVKNYIVSELEKLGLVYERVLDPETYLDTYTRRKWV